MPMGSRARCTAAANASPSKGPSTSTSAPAIVTNAVGPPPMIEAGRRAFVAAGLPEDRLYYDSFDYAPDVLAALIRARSATSSE